MCCSISYNNGINYHMTMNTIFSAVLVQCNWGHDKVEVPNSIRDPKVANYILHYEI